MSGAAGADDFVPELGARCTVALGPRVVSYLAEPNLFISDRYNKNQVPLPQQQLQLKHFCNPSSYGRGGGRIEIKRMLPYEPAIVPRAADPGLVRAHCGYLLIQFSLLVQPPQNRIRSAFCKKWSPALCWSNSFICQSELTVTTVTDGD